MFDKITKDIVSDYLKLLTWKILSENTSLKDSINWFTWTLPYLCKLCSEVMKSIHITSIVKYSIRKL